MSNARALDLLERRLGHEFADRRLLRQALTHKSAGSENNERLEFLGDAALGFIVAQMAFQAYPSAAEAHLTLVRAKLVKRKTLAAVGREMGLGNFLALGQGERKAGVRMRESVLSDAVEALLGAVVLDGGLESADAAVRALIGPRLDAIAEADLKDPKTRLQEFAQSKGAALPEYRLIDTGGSGHAPTFAVRCTVADLELEGRGEGGSRREAEKNAAAAVLHALNTRPPDHQPTDSEAIGDTSLRDFPQRNLGATGKRSRP